MAYALQTNRNNPFEQHLLGAKTRFAAATNQPVMSYQGQGYNQAGQVQQQYAPPGQANAIQQTSFMPMPMWRSQAILENMARKYDAAMAAENPMPSFAGVAGTRADIPLSEGMAHMMYQNSARGYTNPSEQFRALGGQYGFDSQGLTEKWGREGILDNSAFPTGQYTEYPMRHQLVQGASGMAGSYSTPNGRVAVDANGRKIRDLPGAPSEPLRMQVMGPLRRDNIVNQGTLNQPRGMTDMMGNQAPAAYRTSTTSRELVPGEAQWIQQNRANYASGQRMRAQNLYYGATGQAPLEQDFMQAATQNVRSGVDRVGALEREIAQLRDDLARMTGLAQNATKNTNERQTQGLPLDDNTAAEFLRKANGDNERARQLAREAGYAV